MGSIVMEELKINGVIYAIDIHQNDSSLPYLLMLHGFIGDSRVFHHLIEGLYQTCNPITVDLMGHGESEKSFDPVRYNEEHQIEDIIELIQQIRLSPIFLYGYSMGGRLALKAALEDPELFKGLILESTTYGIWDDNKRSKRRKIDKHRAYQIEKDYKAFLTKWEKLALFQSPIEVDKQLVTKYKNIHLNQNPKAMAASLIGFGTGSMKPVKDFFPGFNKPAMIIAGSGDQKYMEISHSLASYFNNVHLCHIKAGHRIHLDNPKELVQEIIFFIDQNSYL